MKQSQQVKALKTWLPGSKEPGYEVVISLDLSAYAQVQVSSAAADRSDETPRQNLYQEPANIELSSYDLSFLKALKIKADENLPC
jgi:hypothetical protein